MHGLKYLRLLFLAVAATFVLFPAIVGGQTSEPKSNRTGSISGDVMVGGKPAGGMSVGAFGGDNPVNRRIPAAQTTTESEGSYHLTGLAARNYQITTFATNLTNGDPDDRGVYRIYGLPAGRYKVSVGADASRGYVGGVNGYFQSTYHPDATDPTRATIIDLAEGGEATNVDIRVGRYDETIRSRDASSILRPEYQSPAHVLG